MVVNVLANLATASGAQASVEVLFLFLLAAGVTGVTAVGFAVWAAFHLIRLVVLLFARVLFGPAAKKPAAGLPPHAVCPDPVCRAVNPDFARFCRQCGRMLRGPSRPT